jgi:hypothetical protein
LPITAQALHLPAAKCASQSATEHLSESARRRLGQAEDLLTGVNSTTCSPAILATLLPTHVSDTMPTFDIVKECRYEGGSAANVQRCSQDETVALGQPRRYAQVASGGSSLMAYWRKPRSSAAKGKVCSWEPNMP